MRSTLLSVLAAFGSALIFTSYAATESRATAATVPVSPRITVLYDAFGKDSMMTKDWGYAALVEISGKHILFDTGDDPEILAKNAKAKGVGDRYVYAGLGTTLHVGANQRAESDPKASSNLSEDELRSYRALLAQSDDFNDSPEVVRFAQVQ